MTHEALNREESEVILVKAYDKLADVRREAYKMVEKAEREWTYAYERVKAFQQLPPLKRLNG